MNPMPPEIQVESVRDDVSYLLPARPVRKHPMVLVMAAIMLVFGLGFVASPLSTICGHLKNLLSGSTEPFGWFFTVFLIPFVIAGLIPMGMGLFLLFGRIRIEWRENRLSVVDHIGPLRWRRRVSKEKDRIRKFSVSQGGTKVNNKPVTSGPLADMGAMSVEFEQGKPRLVTMGYPSGWLQAIAQDLSVRAGAYSPSFGAPKVEIVDMTKEQSADTEITEKPAGCPIHIESTPGRLLLAVPPSGLWKGTRGFFVFSIFWCLFMTVFTSLAYGAMHSENASDFPWFVWLFILGFWGIGIGMMLGAINMGRRHAMLAVQGGCLKVTQTGLFGTKQREWQRQDIAAIRCDASGMEVNDVPVLELQIHPVSGKKAGYFAGRGTDELQWMASTLRKALQVKGRQEEKMVPGAGVEPTTKGL